LLHETDYQEYTFNNQVMQILLELSWIQKNMKATDGQAQAPPGKGNNGKSNDMSIDYARFLAQLLMMDSATANLKAAVCHELIKGQNVQLHFPVLLPALVETLKSGNVYLKTYCTATLVNMSGGQELAKNTLMALDISPIAAEHLRWKDDGLIQYTLALLTNLTKSLHHRQTIKECGVVEQLMELLFNMHQCDDKPLILAELCSVIGQLCNDEDIWRIITQHQALDRIMGMFQRARTGTKLRSKAMFAAKQLSANTTATDSKREIAKTLLAPIMIDLHKMSLPEGSKGAARLDLDNATNAVMLLMSLSSVADIKLRMYEEKPPMVSDHPGMEAIIMQLMGTIMGELDSTRERLQQLHGRLLECKQSELMVPRGK